MGARHRWRAGLWRTRWRRFSRWRCCSPTWAMRAPPRASSAPSARRSRRASARRTSAGRWGRPPSATGSPRRSPTEGREAPALFPAPSPTHLSFFLLPCDVLVKTQNSSRDVVFLSAVRTPFGTFGGAFRDLSAIDLTVFAAKAAMERAKVEPAEIQQSIFGNVMQTTSDTIYFARHVGLRSGCPIETPGLTVNRLCGSGFQAVVNGAEEILLGESEICLVGGGESMSQAPHVLRGLRWGLSLGKMPPLEDALWEGLKDPVAGLAMAETAEKLAVQYNLDRGCVDEYALRSQQMAKAAWDAGVFDDEVIGIPVKNPKTRQVEEFRRDEHMRPDTTLEGLAKLRPVFKQDGVVTAGNASGIGDGAGALVVCSEEFAKTKNAKPLARLVSWGIAGV